MPLPLTGWGLGPIPPLPDASSIPQENLSGADVRIKCNRGIKLLSQDSAHSGSYHSSHYDKALDPVALSSQRFLGTKVRQIRIPLPVLFPVPPHTKSVCPEKVFIVILQRSGSKKQRGRPVSRTPSPHPFLPGQGPRCFPDLKTRTAPWHLFAFQSPELAGSLSIVEFSIIHPSFSLIK